MKIKPTNDLLLVRRNKPEDIRTESGLYLPPTEENLDTPYTGMVIAAGPGKRASLAPLDKEFVESVSNLLNAFHHMPNIDWGARGISLSLWQRVEKAFKAHEDGCGRLPMTVKEGDTVVFSRHGHQVFKINGEELTSLQEASCLGILES